MRATSPATSTALPNSCEFSYSRVHPKKTLARAERRAASDPSRPRNAYGTGKSTIGVAANLLINK